jgi:hypothetical protein
VPVGPHRQRRRVPELAGDVDHAPALVQQQRGEGVAQVVRTLIGDPCRRERLRPEARDPLLVADLGPLGTPRLTALRPAEAGRRWDRCPAASRNPGASAAGYRGGVRPRPRAARARRLPAARADARVVPPCARGAAGSPASSSESRYCYGRSSSA